MSYVHPAWLEHQRQRFTKPEPIQRKTYTERLLEERRAAEEEEEQAAIEAEQDALERKVLQLRRELATLKLEYELRCFQRKYSPDQPRVPKGDPKGGQWTKEGAGDAGKDTDEPTEPGVPKGDPKDGESTQDSGGDARKDPSEPSDPRVRLANGLPTDIPPEVDVDENIKKAEANRSSFSWFYSQVRNKGPWDYKQIDKRYADFGNFNYGATGRAAGFSEATLLRAAGWAQVQAGTSRPEWGTPVTRFEALLGIGGVLPFGDDPNDQRWISRGFRYYDAYVTRQRQRR